MPRYYRNRTLLLALAALACWVMLAGGTPASACPFCNATQQTLSEELAAASASVIATLEKPIPEVDLDDPTADEPAGTYAGAQFRVLKVLRGEELVQADQLIEVVYFGSDDPDKQFLINGIQGDQLEWTTPLPLLPGGAEYIEKLVSLSATGRERLKFFLHYLESDDPLLAQDAYDEFARAPYADLIDLKDDLNHDELVRWINNPLVGPTHRRLYLTMLGVCGSPEDVDMLESLLNYSYESMQPGVGALVSVMGLGGSALGAPLVDELVQADVRVKQQCLDALIAAYLKLKGADGLPLVEERFLANPHAEYSHQYAAIMALRFHGEESSEIPVERLVKSLRLLLDNSEIADQVIPDLTRWEDWEIMDSLVQKFKDADEEGWIRQPVIAYLLTAEEVTGEVGVKAAAYVAEMEKLDPESVKRARSTLAFGLMARGGAGPIDGAPADEESPSPAEEPTETETTQPPAAADETTPKAESEAPPENGLANPTTTDEPTPAPPSRTMIIGLSLAVGLVLMGLFAVMLRGGHEGK